MKKGYVQKKHIKLLINLNVLGYLNLKNLTLSHTKRTYHRHLECVYFRLRLSFRARG